MMRPRLNRSPVWLYFSKDYENNVARCMMCHHDFKVMPNHSTTNLLNHLRKNHKINPHMTEPEGAGFPPPMDGVPQMELEQHHVEGMNPYAWLNFDKLNDTTVLCRLCYENKEVQLVPGKEMNTIVRHLADKHPQAHKAYFGEDPDAGQSSNEQIEATIDNQMKELFQPMRALPLKEEPEEENEGEVQVIQENRQPNPVPTHQPQHRPMYIPPSHFKEGPHHATSHPIFYQNGNGVQNIRRRLSPSPSEATRISADSPPLEKKSKPITGFGFDNDDEFKALGNLVEKELRSVAQKDPNLATKYQISIQEELTKMKKEVLFKLQFN